MNIGSDNGLVHVPSGNIACVKISLNRCRHMASLDDNGLMYLGLLYLAKPTLICDLGDYIQEYGV